MMRFSQLASHESQAGLNAQAILSRSPKVSVQKKNTFAPVQSACGNQGMLKLMGDGVLQRKLTINQPGDVFEQEADRVADAVMRMADRSASLSPITQVEVGGLQRCSCGKSSAGQCEECKAQGMQLQRLASSSASATAPPVVHDVLRSTGHSLDAPTRSFMESRFGQDFSDVRLHTGAKAAESARAVNALAYTVGNNVVFSDGQYAPQSQSGRKLLAHELSHVLQQRATRGASSTPVVQRACFSAVGHPACDDVDPSHKFVDGLLFKFNINCDDFAGDGEKQLFGLGTGLRPDAKVEIHGYASTDGPKDFNETLACARALKARSVLKSAGVLESSFTKVISHGPTAGPAAERRSVTILITGPSPKKEIPEPKKETGEKREAPSAVKVETTKPGEESGTGPAKPPTVKTPPIANESHTPDDSTRQTTPSPPSHLVEFNGEANIKIKRLFRGAEDPTLSKLCRNAEIEGKLSAKLKLDGVGIGERVHLFYHEPTFSMSFFPFQCSKPPEEKLEVDLVNIEIVPKILEFSLKPGLTLADELKPGLSAEAEWKPWGKNNNFLGHLKISGELEMKYETDATKKRTTTIEGSLGVGVEY